MVSILRQVVELALAPAADFAPTTPLVTTGGRTDAVERREAQRYGEARQRAVRQVVPSELHGRLVPVRMMHLITNLAGRGWHIPKNVTARAEKYH